MTSTFSAYAEAHSEIFGSAGLEETWYIGRDDAQPGTAPFYRLYSPLMLDHMDSHDPSEGSAFGYSSEFVVGYPWTSERIGMRPLTRYFQPSTFNHLTWLPAQTPEGFLREGSGWDSDSGNPRYGYPRYGTPLQVPNLGTDLPHASLSNSKYAIRFNLPWGGGLDSIVHRPTGQELVRPGIGEMVQGTVWSGAGNQVNGSCCTYNPTQAGGVDSAHYSNVQHWAGSPLLQVSGSGSNPFIAEVRPLNFFSDSWGNDGYGALLWRGSMRHSTSVGFSIAGQQFDDTIAILLEARVDPGVPADDDFNLNEVEWLRLEPFQAIPGNITSSSVFLELVDVNTGGTQSIPLPGGFNESVAICIGAGCDVQQSAAGRAIVFGTQNPGSGSGGSSLTIGVYSPSTSVYSVGFWCDGQAPSGGACPQQYQTVVINQFAFRRLSTTYVGTNHYLVVGSHGQVTQRLRQINCQVTGGVNCASPLLRVGEAASGEE